MCLTLLLQLETTFFAIYNYQLNETALERIQLLPILKHAT